MKFRIDVIRIGDDGSEQTYEMIVLERGPLAMETLGLTLAESKALLHQVQAYVVEQQAASYLEEHRACPQCGRPHTSKEQGQNRVHTVFGPVAVPNPRWHRCACQPAGPKTFRPTANWLNSQTSPELLYLE